MRQGSRQTTATDGDLQRAIARLLSLEEGNDGLLETVAVGHSAIPALRQALFKREPSGIFEGRCRVVEALSRLGADDVLLDYLQTPRAIEDPIERTGEDAVINATARALAKSPDPNVLAVMLRFARDRPRQGIIEALTGRRRFDALPYFIRGLEEDTTRREAAKAILALGPAARPALLSAAVSPSMEVEPESSKRRRRIALHLYGDLGGDPAQDQAALLGLIDDRDYEVAVTACDIWLSMGGRPDAAVPRLVDLLGRAGWIIDAKIGDCLVKHFDVAEAIVSDALKVDSSSLDIPLQVAQRKVGALCRLLRRMGERRDRSENTALAAMSRSCS
jgi:hypothetical protein